MVLLFITCLTVIDPAVSGSLELTVLSEDAVDIELNEMRSLHLDSLRSLADGEVLLFLSKVYSGNDIDLYPMGWSVESGEHGTHAYQTGPGEMPVLRFHRRPEDNFQKLTAISLAGDTLWTVTLDETCEYDNNMLAYPLSGGDLLLISHTDCWSTCTYVARVSGHGDLLWAEWLETEYLLDLPENECECKPRIQSVRETADGNLLLCGSVEQWVTSADSLFVTMLAGGNGEPVWKTLYSGLGEALALDVIQTSSGRIIAVGATSETAYTDSFPAADIWSADPCPLVMVLDENGELLEAEIALNTSAEAFHKVIQAECEDLFILGSSGDGCLLIRALLQ